MIKIVKMKQVMKMVMMKVMEMEMFKLMDMFRLSKLLTNLWRMNKGDISLWMCQVVMSQITQIPRTLIMRTQTRGEQLIIT